MSSFSIPPYRAIDNNGDPAGGAKLYFYEAGTTTPLDTYSDEALASANANPVVADGDGWFGPVYMKTDQAYKVVLKDTTAATTFYTEDDVYCSQLASGALVTRVKQIGSNPVDYGAVGDGVADETSEVQSAITNATGVVDLLGLTYRCDTTLTVPGGVTLRNGTLDFSNSSSSHYITMIGSLGDSKAGSTDIDIGDHSAETTAVAHGFSAGDVIVLQDSQSFVGAVPNSLVFRPYAVAATTITPTNKWPGSWATASSITFRKATGVEHVRFEDLTVIGSNTGGITAAVYAKYAADIRFSHVRFEQCRAMASIDLVSCMDVMVDNCEFVDGDDSGCYGVRLDGCINTTIRDCSFEYCEYGVYSYPSDGPTRHNEIHGCKFHRCGAGVYALEGTDDITIANCEFGHYSNAILDRSVALRVNGCSFRSDTGHGISRDEKTSYLSYVDNVEVVVSDCTFQNTDSGGTSKGVNLTGDGGVQNAHVHGCRFTNLECGVSISTPGGNITDVSVDQCKFLLMKASGGRAVDIDASAVNLTRAAVRGCSSDGLGGIWIDGNASTVMTDIMVSGNSNVESIRTYQGVLTRVSILDNSIAGVTTGVLVNATGNVAGGSTDVIVAGNRIMTASAQGIYIDADEELNRVTVRDNHIICDGVGILVDNSVDEMDQLVITGNLVNTTGSTNRGISLASASDITYFVVVANNCVWSNGSACYLDGRYLQASITGNTLNVTGNSSNLCLDGTNADDIRDVAISGNVIYDGTYGIYLNNCEDLASVPSILADGNRIGGQSLGAVLDAGADLTDTDNLKTA